MSERWTPDSWRTKPVQQVPVYPDPKALGDVEAQLATFPPLVFAGEARNLKKAYGDLAAEGFVGRMAAAEKARERIEKEQELRAQAHIIRSSEAIGRRHDTSLLTFSHFACWLNIESTMWVNAS